MTVRQLEDIGLTNSQAKAYLALLKYQSLTPPQLAKIISETRTNAYSILDKLEELKLVQQIEKTKKTYKASNPTHLEDFVKKQKAQAQIREEKTRRMLPELTQMYFKIDSEPGIRFFKGKGELKKIYEEQIDSKKTIYFVRSPADIAYYGFDYIHNVRLTPAVKYGTQRYGLVPDGPEAYPTREKDRNSNLKRTWIAPEDYTAKVEWTIFGDKVSVISFGKEGIGMIIESPQIAESMRQIFKLAEAGAKVRYPKPKRRYKG